VYKYRRTFPHLIHLISSHLSLSCAEKRLFSTAQKRDLSHTCGGAVADFRATTAEVKFDLRGA